MKPLDPVSISLGSAPPRGAALLQAVKLGLELENDIRVATDRINRLKLPVVPNYVPLPPVDAPESSDSEIEDLTDLADAEWKGMPLL